MKVFVWTSTDADIPPGHENVARIWNGKEGWHPVILNAATSEGARQRAQDWWDAELAKERDKQAASARRVAAMQAKKGRPPVSTPEVKTPVEDEEPIL